MQLDAGVVRAGQAAAAQAAGRHAEIAAVLLHHHVGGDLRRAEQRMLRLVDRERLGNAVRRRPGRRSPSASPARSARSRSARRRRPCSSTCGRTAIPGRACRAASSRFSVPTALVSKSSNGIAAARSCDGCAAVCTMSVGADVRDQIAVIAGAIADVDSMMVEVLQRPLEPLLIPARVARRRQRTPRAGCCRRRGPGSPGTRRRRRLPSRSDRTSR